MNTNQIKSPRDELMLLAVEVVKKVPQLRPT